MPRHRRKRNRPKVLQNAHHSESRSKSGDPFTLTDIVKSRILDRVLKELAEEVPLGIRPSRYTRSASGIYGKYEKYDADMRRMLDTIRSELEKMVKEAVPDLLKIRPELKRRRKTREKRTSKRSSG